METFDEADSGYPEEQPGSGDGDGDETGSDVRERARPEQESDRAPDNEDGTATGNPGAAGARDD